MSGAESDRTTTAGVAVRVGPLRPDEHDALYEVFSRIVAEHEGFPHAPPLTPEVFASTWVSGVSVSVVARVVSGTGEELAGAYYLRPNFVGRAAHIANAGYVVATRWRRLGIGRSLVEDSVARAPELGFDAIQFNLVFASNPARALYEELGWHPVGRVPDAVDGEDAIIYWRRV
ncbi:MAG TPA: GNAT family N-acetyltransferase [Acidimicrobiales bacterium]|nr:GNAT family N-acetyltransferase [Acidimicrobiales bacterium]